MKLISVQKKHAGDAEILRGLAKFFGVCLRQTIPQTETTVNPRPKRIVTRDQLNAALSR